MRTLREIGEHFGTDKVTLHRFDSVYSKLFSEFRDREITLLEIGVAGGASLRMWEEYFPRARIIGIDFEPQCLAHQGGRRQVIIGSAADPHFLNRSVESIGSPLDIIIDDGSHLMRDQQTAFSTLFPHIRPGGWYVVEDLETSYYPKFGGGVPGMDGTMIAYLKSLLDYQQHAYHNTSDPLFSKRSSSVNWTPLVPLECRSFRGSELVIDGAHRITASGINPVSDIYLARYRARPGMPGLRLNVHPESGGAGPGRVENGNFALTQMVLRLHGSDWSRTLPMRLATASFEQDGCPAPSVLSPDTSSSWAIYPDVQSEQSLSLVLAGRTEAEPAELTVILRQASVPFHNIRRFSLDATDSDLLFRADGQPMIAGLCFYPNIAFIQRG